MTAFAPLLAGCTLLFVSTDGLSGGTDGIDGGGGSGRLDGGGLGADGSDALRDGGRNADGSEIVLPNDGGIVVAY